MKISITTSKQGQIAEEVACRYLHRQGLKLLERNFRSPAGEIDLVMRDGDIIVFVEVRYRSSSKIATAAETISSSKRRRIINSGRHYLQKHRLINTALCRFDVVAIGQDAAAIEWIRNAFET